MSSISNGRERVAAILCRRDNCTIKEAEERINEAIDAMEMCGYDPIDCEEIMASYLGLEPDYILDLLM